MIWLAVLILAGAIFALAVWRLRVPRSAYGALAAALAVGLAGYAVQGRPDLPDRPTDPVQADADNPGLLVDLRRKVTNSTIPPLNRWVIVSDALARNGDYASAAGILRAAIEEDPKNSEAWLALGNALLMHAHGYPSPAAFYAYRRAGQADPKAPGPPFFTALALATSGKLPQAAKIWADLLTHAPKDAPWKPLVQLQLAHVESTITAQPPAQPES
ncbi:tetratricopeptide repeat protein [Novosphingobium sp. 9]|uniref:tetratricopeptide repeat protein n=1 Tax=Novosphingobium sp. 9 TaxID=2025349 RepID=UPI0021B56DE4|nr:tetratricopeptide repeat protein [Novosphingobium sp. 9]